MAQCFPHGLEFGVEAAKEALREVFYQRHGGDFEVEYGLDQAFIKSPYCDDVVADVCMVDVAGDLWACVSLTPYGPYRNGDEVDAFDAAVHRIVKEREVFLRGRKSLHDETEPDGAYLRASSVRLQ